VINNGTHVKNIDHQPELNEFLVNTHLVLDVFNKKNKINAL